MWAVVAQYSGPRHERGEIISVHETYEAAHRRAARDTHFATREVPAGTRKGMRYTGDSVFPVGRPTELNGGKRVNVYLDQASLDAATALGNGNVSEGIRRALAK
jgi:hypothetical protein